MAGLQHNGLLTFIDFLYCTIVVLFPLLSLPAPLVKLEYAHHLDYGIESMPKRIEVRIDFSCGK